MGIKMKSGSEEVVDGSFSWGRRKKGYRKYSCTLTPDLSENDVALVRRRAQRQCFFGKKSRELIYGPRRRANPVLDAATYLNLPNTPSDWGGAHSRALVCAF